MVESTTIPAHLRAYVVEQDYAAYTARDQDVWRFVVGQGHARLRALAHPAYAAGFRAAGISTERIPNLREMSARLAETGFRVVCVDGFIPPRAFQAFQARGILPVAADIRTAAHLTYTPAPDIIHEAAGHAPFLAEPDYARFLRRIGALSEHAFESAHDRATYRAIYTLSELKESPDSTAQQVADAEAEVLALQRGAGAPSEATRMARLYWWTVEYGLVGTLDDFRLYGAGLLSSIGEAHFCQDPRVKKLPLSAACSEVDYDITQAQPQLFVVRDFGELDAVLDDVAGTLGHARGGEHALAAAHASGDVCALRLDAELQVIGTLVAYDAGHARLTGACTYAAEHTTDAGRWPELVVPLGELADGTSLARLSEERLAQSVVAGELTLRTRHGLTITGRVQRVHALGGLVRVAELVEARIQRGDTCLLACAGRYPLVFASRVLTASPALPDGYHAATAFSPLLVPRPRTFSPDEAALIACHDTLSRLRAEGDHAALCAFAARTHAQLARHPHEWLLRFNLLEALVEIAADPARQRALRDELALLERHFHGREPIALALRSLARL